MRKPELKMEFSADGFVGRPDGYGWAFDSGFDDGVTEHIVEISHADPPHGPRALRRHGRPLAAETRTSSAGR